MTDPKAEEAKRLSELLDQGYGAPKLFQNGGWAGLMTQGSFTSVVCGSGERWVYQTFQRASAALHEWDGNGQPSGWISAS